MTTPVKLLLTGVYIAAILGAVAASLHLVEGLAEQIADTLVVGSITLLAGLEIVDTWNA